MDTTPSAAPAKKQAAKRTNLAPWNAAIMGTKASPVPVPSVGRPSPSSSSGHIGGDGGRNGNGGRNHNNRVDPSPARISSDISLPSTEPPQQRHPNGLAGTSRMRELQEKWEKELSKTVLGETGRSSSTPGTPVNPGQPTPANAQQSSATPSLAATKPAPPKVSPVPVPAYGITQKRSNSEMNGRQEEPQAKRQQSGSADTNANNSAPAENLKAATLTEAQRFTEAATSHHPSHSIDVDARVSSPDVTAAGAGARAPVVGPDYRVPPYRRDMVEVEVDGTIWPIIRMADNRRRYADYEAPDGTLVPANGAIIPRGYIALPTEEAPFVCPVRDCRKRVDNLRGLGSHFSAVHAMTTFNDNGDGTVSKVAMYERGQLKHAPGVIVSQNPLPPDAPPPAAPTLSFSNQLRNTARVSVPKSDPSWSPASTPLVSIPQASTPPPLTESDAVTYLHAFLSRKQATPRRADIDYMVKLPRRRDMPDRWLQHHQGEILDANHYTCAIAYMVGDEVHGVNRCTMFETTASVQKPFCRLSERCIRLPAEMPLTTREYFSRLVTCVGCRYWSHLRKGANPCTWNTKPRGPARPPGERPTPPAIGASKAYNDNDDVYLPAPSRESQVGDAGPETERIRGLRKRKSNLSVTPLSSAAPPEQPNDGGDVKVMEMADWEFTPGKALDKTESEAIAFSVSYLSTSQPVTISDDVSVYRMSIRPGETHRWPTEHDKLQYWEVIKGRVQVKSGGRSLAVGPGGIFVIRPGMSCKAENRLYDDAVLSCHITSNYSLMP